MIPFIINWRAAVRSAVLVGGGDIPGVDIATVTGANKRPYVPATSWKGRLRHTCEAIANALGMLTCTAPDAAEMCPSCWLQRGGGAQVLEFSYAGRDYGPTCPVCRIFGSPWWPSPIRLTDLTFVRHQEGLTRTVDPTLRWQVSISRQTRSASAGRLFVAQVASPAGGPGTIEAAGSITGAVPEEDLLGLLVAGLLSLETLGHARSRGLGWLGPPIIELKVRAKNGEATEEMKTIEDPAAYAEEKLRLLVQRYKPHAAHVPDSG